MTLALVERADERLSALERLEVLCDHGSLQLIRTQVPSRALSPMRRERTCVRISCSEPGSQSTSSRTSA